MLLRRARAVFTLGLLLTGAAIVRAQSSTSAVEESRLFERTAPPTSGNLTVDGNSTSPGPEGSNPQDESFGAQQILKAQQKIPELTISASGATYYTNNVALTRRNTISDSLWVGSGGVSWTPRINSQLQFQLGGGASVFRYFDTTPLDFENLGVGTGVLWTPPNFWDVGVLGRYDFTELLDTSSRQILQDHEFSFALQKLLVLGRSHALTFGLIASAGVSDPSSEQRDQVGVALGYHLQLTRQLGSDFGYRVSGFFYNKGGRNDLNQVFSTALHYYVRPWASIDGLVSGAVNSSNRAAFRYSALTTGGGVSITLHF